MNEDRLTLIRERWARGMVKDEDVLWLLDVAEAVDLFHAAYDIRGETSPVTKLVCLQMFEVYLKGASIGVPLGRT